MNRTGKVIVGTFLSIPILFQLYLLSEQRPSKMPISKQDKQKKTQRLTQAQSEEFQNNIKQFYENMKEEKAFSIVRIPERSEKPREIGITEVRDSGLGLNALQDLLETMGEYIDVFKHPCGSQRLMSRDYIKKKIRLAKD